MFKKLFQFQLKKYWNQKTGIDPTAPSKNVKITIDEQEEEEPKKKCC